MKIEEAIKIFEDWAKCNYEPTKQAAQLALTALRSMPEARETFHIDRNEWKPCVDCRIKCRNCVVRGKEKCARCEKYSEYVPENNFCSNCGRPLTEEAWAELERRLSG